MFVEKTAEYERIINESFCCGNAVIKLKLGGINDEVGGSMETPVKTFDDFARQIGHSTRS